MKQLKYILIVALTVLLSKPAVSQQSDIDLEDLKIPNSPAFILLDVAPTAIDRPTTTKAFSTSILNNVNKNNGIPQNYAVEFTPYWFFKHPKLTAFKYWGYDKEADKQVAFSQAKFLSASFATVNSIVDSLTGETQNNMSFGIRSTLINVRKKSDIEALVTNNEKHLTRLKKINEDNIDKTPEEVIDIVENDPILKAINKDINEILNRKPVLAVDFASATSWAFDNADYNSGRFNRFGAWLTLSFSKSINSKNAVGKRNYISIYATSRYLNDKNTLENGELVLSDLLDNGGKIELEIDRFSLSYEYLHRVNFTDKDLNSFRSSGLLKYAASEKVSITAAFGRNFGETNNLITQIGINWGINGANSAVLPK